MSNPRGVGKFGNGMMAIFLFFDNRICKVCGSRIGPIGVAYALPAWYRQAMGLGPCDNETHCPSCHTDSELANGGQCQFCKHSSFLAPDARDFLFKLEEARKTGLTLAIIEAKGERHPEWFLAGMRLIENGGEPTLDWALAQPEIRKEILE